MLWRIYKKGLTVWVDDRMRGTPPEFEAVKGPEPVASEEGIIIAPVWTISVVVPLVLVSNPDVRGRNVSHLRHP